MAVKFNIQITAGDDVPEVTKADAEKSERNSSIAITLAAFMPTLAQLYDRYFGGAKICPDCLERVRQQHEKHDESERSDDA